MAGREWFWETGGGGEGGGVDGANIDCYRVFGAAAASESRHRHHEHSKTYNISKTTMTTRYYRQPL